MGWENMKFDLSREYYVMNGKTAKEERWTYSGEAEVEGHDGEVFYVLQETRGERRMLVLSKEYIDENFHIERF